MSNIPLANNEGSGDANIRPESASVVCGGRAVPLRCAAASEFVPAEGLGRSRPHPSIPVAPTLAALVRAHARVCESYIVMYVKRMYMDQQSPQQR